MEKKISIKDLFEEKKYSEVVFLIDNRIPENQKNSAVLNLLGISRLLKGKPNKQDFLLAINDFKKALLKEKRTKNSLEAFKNFINVSVELYKFEKSTENHQIVNKFFKEILNIYDENKDYFSKDEFLLLSLIRVHTELNDLDKVREYLEELIKNKFYSWIFII